MKTKDILGVSQQIRVVTEVVDDADLVKEIKELTHRLRELRKLAVMKYCPELDAGELLYNAYCDCCYVYLGEGNELHELNGVKI